MANNCPSGDNQPVHILMQSEVVTVEETLFLTYLLTVVGLILGLLIIGKMIMERRRPSNVIIWGMLVIFIPYLGVPLYLVFGGRKSQWLLRNKRSVQAVATSTAREALGRENDLELVRRYAGNTFELHGDGQVAFEALLREIRNAKSSIYIMTYILGRDETARAIVEALTKRAAEGVKVCLLVDALGSFGRTGSFVKALREAGGEVAAFMPVWPIHYRHSANLRNHRKIALFDGVRAIVGGQNLDARFMGPKKDPERFADFNALLAGPIVTVLNRIFVSDWCYAAKQRPKEFKDYLAQEPSPVGGNEMEVIASGPDASGDPLWEKIILLIQECRESLTIVTPYFIPDEVIFQSLLVKAKAGYKVRLVVPEHSNRRVVDFARGYYLRKLHEAGSEILLYQPVMKHAKLMLVDGKVAMMGSANLDMRSLFLNFEVSVFQNSPGPIAELERWVEEALPHCTHWRPEIHGKAGPSKRLLEDLTHLIVPLL